MAVMLRLLGIPSRVAVGFTAGTWKAGVWTVTDQQAHAWVEAWFDGFGWLAFDPTPGRGTLSAVYTLASDSADAVAALGTGRFLDFNPSFEPGETPAATPVEPPSTTSFPWWLIAVPRAAAAIGSVIGASGSARPASPARPPRSRGVREPWRRSSTAARRTHRSRPRPTSAGRRARPGHPRERPHRCPAERGSGLSPGAGAAVPARAPPDPETPVRADAGRLLRATVSLRSLTRSAMTP
jgi:hypothetical protein